MLLTIKNTPRNSNVGRFAKSIMQNKKPRFSESQTRLRVSHENKTCTKMHFGYLFQLILCLKGK